MGVRQRPLCRDSASSRQEDGRVFRDMRPLDGMRAWPDDDRSCVSSVSSHPYYSGPQGRGGELHRRMPLKDRVGGGGR